MKKNLVMLIMISLCISLFSQFKLDLKYSDATDATGTLLVSASALAAAYLFDEQIRLAVPKIKNFSIDSLTDAKISLGLSSALLVSSLFFDCSEFKDVAFRSFQAGTASAAVGYLLKHAAGRARPFTEEGKNSFMGWTAASDDYLSFPSGHSIVAWAVVTPYAQKYGQWLYILPLTVSAMRIIEDKHWTSDVIAASALGFILGTFMPYLEISF
ncbi:MAG TPA: phosphatase PAP2 family protein [Petrotogaceae bacterium]|nr:phosphatase PAP2 family protein [Petrotogaceae bacterium]HQI79185.1 phosphatase PAP2 family protein [Petrotogaceae bacterium]